MRVEDAYRVLRVILRMLIFLVVAGMTWLLEMVVLVIIAGEVSCFEVCSPAWEFVDRYQPLPFIVGVLVAIGAGWGASLLAKPD